MPYLNFRRLTALACFLSAVIAYVYFGLIGTDFGWHWDEQKLFSSIEHTATTGLILPRWYQYPSLSYLLTLISAASYIGINAIS